MSVMYFWVTGNWIKPFLIPCKYPSQSKSHSKRFAWTIHAVSCQPKDRKEPHKPRNPAGVINPWLGLVDFAFDDLCSVHEIIMSYRCLSIDLPRQATRSTGFKWIQWLQIGIYVVRQIFTILRASFDPHLIPSYPTTEIKQFQPCKQIFSRYVLGNHSRR